MISIDFRVKSTCMLLTQKIIVLKLFNKMFFNIISVIKKHLRSRENLPLNEIHTMKINTLARSIVIVP